MEGDRPESAEEYGRICYICLLPKGTENICQLCHHIGNRLTQLQEDPNHGSSLVRMIESLKLWSQEIPTWDVLHWLHQLLQPSVFRERRMSGPRQGLFTVFEGHCGA